LVLFLIFCASLPHSHPLLILFIFVTFVVVFCWCWCWCFGSWPFVQSTFISDVLVYIFASIGYSLCMVLIRYRFNSVIDLLILAVKYKGDGMAMFWWSSFWSQ
jgi:hypothetical protein